MNRRLAAAIAACAALAIVLSTNLFRTQAQDAKPAAPLPAATEVATFAGGCFWCVESDFDKVPGVLRTISGFMGGATPNPTYHQVTAGGTGHLEAVQVTFDPSKVTYKQLVEYFWRHIDPYDAGGQFCDRGESYMTAIFAATAEQRKIAEASKAELETSGPLKQPIATLVRDAGPFTAAEDYHQDFYQKSPARYKLYRLGCGRDARIESIWGKSATGH
jgi:methionine-S-sulfoxide reductase